MKSNMTALGLFLTIDSDIISISSRNEKELSPQFPEIIAYIKDLDLEDYLPLQLDGELVWLTNQAKADFFFKYSGEDALGNNP
ncbi:hypothetical protein RCO48_34930 [Peribacillus frigoritolerans]|nr:hypothetical protein [Peribacillus frigoritolerans]